MKISRAKIRKSWVTWAKKVFPPFHVIGYYGKFKYIIFSRHLNIGSKIYISIFIKDDL